MKRIIAHPAKARYVEAHAKGLSLDTANEPKVDDPDFDEMKMHVPLDQIGYVGDGLSDLDAFRSRAATQIPGEEQQIVVGVVEVGDIPSVPASVQVTDQRNLPGSRHLALSRDGPRRRPSWNPTDDRRHLQGLPPAEACA